MKLWLERARPLPVCPRPVGGETIPSYARRLAHANDLHPTTILRAVGEQHSTGDHHRAPKRDACLNDLAADRLASYADIPLARLIKALPALETDTATIGYYRLPTDRPALRYYIPNPCPRPACNHCQTRTTIDPTQPTAMVLRTARAGAPLLCHRHRRWLGTSPNDTSQYDLTRADDVLTAEHRYRQLLTGNPEHNSWIAENFDLSWRMTQRWAQHPPSRLPHTFKRWRSRAAVLGTTGPATPIISFPEAVALAEILTDLHWRRHVAMALKPDLSTFYQHLVHHLGEPANPREADRHTAAYRLLWGQTDLLTRWVDSHRHRFGELRRNHHDRQKRDWRPLPLPEIRHFR